MKSIYFEADKEMIENIIRANAEDTSVFTGKIVTGETFIDQDGRDRIIKSYNPQCVDMETASIAHVCYANTIPFVAIRSVSDTPFESGSVAFEKYSKRAGKKSIEILIKYLDLL